MTDRVAEAFEAGHRLLGERPLDVETPGGRNRDSVRLRFPDRSVIATQRKSRRRIDLEVFVLRALGERGAPVPAILAYDGTWILQEDLGVLRLSEALARSDPDKAEVLLDQALASLAAVHRAAHESRLAERLRTLGATTDWLSGLIDTPRRIGAHLSLPAPALPAEALYRRLAAGRPSFVKWDARPGNAAVTDGPAVAWFDWEHCGCRNATDDVAWLLGDEYAPNAAEAEARLLRTHLQHFALTDGPDETLDYLRCFGTFHMTVRLALILAKKGTGSWQVGRHDLKNDQVGATAQRARRTCLRAARWAAESSLAKPLAPWLRDVADRLVPVQDRPGGQARATSGRLTIVGGGRAPQAATRPAHRQG